MLVENQKVVLKWHPRNKNRLESLGYEYTGIGEEILVKIQDVSKGSKVMVQVICDYCGEIYNKRYKDYWKQRENDKDCCIDCASKKRNETNIVKYGGNSPSCSSGIVKKQQETCMKKYGVKSPAQSEDIKNKIRKSNLEKYGCENVLKSKEIQQKIKETCKEKYGVEYVGSALEIRKKIQDTCLKKYNSPSPLESSQIQKKIFNTNLEKYGSISPFGNKEIRKKIVEERIYHNNIPSSFQEKILVKNLQLIYGEENCIAQYPLESIWFDCLLVVGDVKIDVEYDGKYWHQNEHKDIKRDYFTVSKGYKVLRFKSDYKSPTEEQIKTGVDYLVNTNHHVKIIDLDI